MPDVIITIRVLMVGKEIGAIIGRGGATIASFREKSGCKINVSTSGPTPERVVTVTGDQSQIREAFRLITEKIELDINSNVSSSDKVPVTMTLIVPASQCGSIIGRGGSKIKQIREGSACAIKVEADTLAGSTERPVTLNGSPSAIVKCIDMLCDVMIEFPAKSATVPYKPNMGVHEPVVFHQGQAYMIQGQFAIPNPDITKLHQLAAMHSYTEDKPGSSLLGNFTSFASPAKDMDAEFEKGASGSFNLPTKVVDADTQEITVSNDVIGCIIGRGGSRINEIRLMSGAQISINRSVNKESTEDRKITISGNPESISLAQYLINTSIQLFANQKPHRQSGSTTSTNEITSSSEEGGESASSSSSNTTGTANPKPLMSLPTRPSNKPIPISQLFGATAFSGYMGGPRMPFGNPFGAGVLGPYPYSGNMGMGPGGAFSAAMQNARRTFMSRSRYSGHNSNRTRHNYKSRVNKEEDTTPEDDDDASPNGGDSSPNGKDKRKMKREKFQPY